MQLFVCVLKERARIDELLLMMGEEGLPGATAVDGYGMGLLFHDEPLLQLFRDQFPKGMQPSYVLFSAVDDVQLEKCFTLFRACTEPLSQGGAGIAFSVPIGTLIGGPRSALESSSESSSSEETSAGAEISSEEAESGAGLVDHKDPHP
ncbi:MAG: hypothetical protein VYD19_06330 [Myxococcota bacterium]|nr:hypothetical protein [Myxococcota bacterium]